MDFCAGCSPRVDSARRAALTLSSDALRLRELLVVLVRDEELGGAGLDAQNATSMAGDRSRRGASTTSAVRTRRGRERHEVRRQCGLAYTGTSSLSAS